MTAQVSEEVQRRKVEVATQFFTDLLKELKPRNIGVPDHLFGTDRLVVVNARLREIQSKSNGMSEELINLVYDLLSQISRSEDGVSKALEDIFSKAAPYDEGEIQRARARKELGKPPGKKADPLGDQLNWEQILSQCRRTHRLWIITRDGDYATEYRGKIFLNAALYQDLVRQGQPVPEVYCFNNIPDGIKHFADKTKVKAEKLPTQEETEEIKKEQESLPPLGWLNLDDVTESLIQYASRRKRLAAWMASLSSPMTMAAGPLRPETNKTEEGTNQ